MSCRFSLQPILIHLKNQWSKYWNLYTNCILQKWLVIGRFSVFLSIFHWRLWLVPLISCWARTKGRNPRPHLNTPQQGQQGNPHKEQAVSLGAMDDRPQLPKFGLRMCFQTSQVQRISISPKVIHPVKMLEFPLTNQRPSANPDSLTVQPFFC